MGILDTFLKHTFDWRLNRVHPAEFFITIDINCDLLPSEIFLSISYCTGPSIMWSWLTFRFSGDSSVLRLTARSLVAVPVEMATCDLNSTNQRGTPFTTKMLIAIMQSSCELIIRRNLFTQLRMLKCSVGSAGLMQSWDGQTNPWSEMSNQEISI